MGSIFIKNKRETFVFTVLAFLAVIFKRKARREVAKYADIYNFILN